MQQDNQHDDEVDPFAPPPPPPSSTPTPTNGRQQHQEIDDDGPMEVLVEYSFRDFERFTHVTPNDMISYQSGKKSFYDVLYDIKTPCGEIYNNMMNYVHNMAIAQQKDISVDDIRDSVERKTFLECIDFHSHLYEVRTKNLVLNIEGNSK
ncbi:predicted protein [Naegleria gruberi]|uniref:Predicted protein n=1 Tax=Naegleria gruberi TaxID=5762 RepID=D2VGD9_NAEGR|nr:uncharacterized protein NAEGRDRAFT_67942 [Naegleria gruberi]EFC43948.1 predicted protein [Naegleria gruberi]|eukprot:XP_002676692.1 predicted protein [Naegleria gruberi strain NEG-M]